MLFDPDVAGKTSLKVFDIRDLPCDRLGRVLLNDVMACGDQSRPRGDCLALIQAAARAPLSLIKERMHQRAKLGAPGALSALKRQLEYDENESHSH